jgi:hypothetical protein
MTPQHPSDLQVIDFQYQHVGVPHIWVGKLVVLPPEYRWLLHLDDNPQAYGQVWKEFNDSAVVIEYVDTALGETVEGRLVQLLSPDPDNDGYHILVTDELIQQLTPMQVFRLWEAVERSSPAVSNEEVVLAPDVDRPALTGKLWAVLVEVRQEYFESGIRSALAPYLGSRVTREIVDSIQTTMEGVTRSWVEDGLIRTPLAVKGEGYPYALRVSHGVLDNDIPKVVIDSADAACMRHLIAKVPNVPVWVMNEDISGTGLKKLEEMAADAMEEYRAGLTLPLDPDTL